MNRSIEDRPFSTKLNSEGGADQAQADSCNINIIVERCKQGGTQPSITRGQGTFGDFSSAPTLHEAYEAVYAASAAFEQLPSAVREAALNNPVQLVEMLDDLEGQKILALAGLDIFDIPPVQGETTTPSKENPAQDSPEAKPSPTPEGGE